MEFRAFGVKGFCMVDWGVPSIVLSDKSQLPPNETKVWSVDKGTVIWTGSHKPHPNIVMGWHMRGEIPCPKLTLL